jgi:hypothetical protein
MGAAAAPDADTLLSLQSETAFEENAAENDMNVSETTPTGADFKGSIDYLFDQLR